MSSGGMTLWTDAQAEAATGGKASGAFAATGLSIDSRSLKPGDMFIALKAARDGHDFVAQAFAAGAAAALVERIPEGVTGPCLVVADVQTALEDLGRAGRNRTRAKVVAVTGSAGKTSTKEMLRDMLDPFGTVHAAEASFNNHWGVPLTLARLPETADFAVIEIGMNHPGEIEPLARLTRPHVAMITTIAPAHLEAFDNIDGIAHEKAAIFAGLEPGGIGVYNADLPTSSILAAAAGAQGMGFGDTGPARRVALTETPQALVLQADVAGTPVHVRLQGAGAHFASNALGCLAVAQALGLDLALAAQGLGRWTPPAGRGRREWVALDPVDDGGFTLIDDAFNANPASMSASLRVLAGLEPGRGGRRIAVLGDMLELGPEETALHRAIAADPSLAGVALVHCVGPRMAALWEALPIDKRGKRCETAEELGAQAHRLVHVGDVLLVKGSKGSKVSRIVDMLRNLGHEQGDK